MSVRPRWASLLASVALLLSLLVQVTGQSTAVAQTATGTTVASGLTAPRFIAVGGDGSLYVSEAGSGGDEKLPLPEGRPPSDPNTPAPTRGYTGRVTKISPDGTKTVVADKLASYGPTSDAAGPNGLVIAGGAIWLAIGGASFDYPNLKPLTNENSVVRINPQTGEVQKVADIGAYETANNPNKDDVNSDLYGMTLGADGNLYVADAGGNCLYKVVPSTGALSVVACFPALPAPPPPPGAPPGEPTVQTVPTGVVAGKDGSIYVGFLALGGIGANIAKVVKVAPNGTVSDAVTGFNAITGLAAGPDGNLYVTELATGFDPNTGPKPGQVTRVLPDGTKQVVASNLVAPNGVDFDSAGNMYVITGTGFVPQGQVMRYDGVAKPAAAPSPTPTPSPTPSPTPAPPTPGLPNTGMAQLDDSQISTVRPEVSDMAMFGKTLSSSLPLRSMASFTELKPGAGPVVPARIRIPALNIDTNVETLGLHNGNMDVPSNIWNTGWLNSSVRPGDVGTAVIDGHKDSVKGTAVFWSLGQLKAGDKVYVSDIYGWELTFEVTEVQSYDLNAAPMDRIFSATGQNLLNLITCDGTFIKDKFTYDKRLVVYTHLVPNS